MRASSPSWPSRRKDGPPACTSRPCRCRPGRPSRRAAEQLRGDDRFVADYFRLELLSRLPQKKRSSSSTRRSWIACAAASATPCSRRPGRRRLLETLERTNGFVVPLDRRGEWYRYHHLFGQLLRRELERSEPDLVPELNCRAMAWCIANDMREAAVVYGQAAGETDTVAGLVEALALPLYYDGRMDTARGVARLVQRRRAGPVSRTRRLRRLVPPADGTPRGGRAVARAGRRGDVGHPALGWQRHDRPVGRPPARAHDARTVSSRRSRRQPGADSVRARRVVGCTSALAIRGVSHALLGRSPTARRTTSPRPSTAGPGARYRDDVSTPRMPSSRCSRRARGTGARLGHTRGPRTRSSTSSGLADYSHERHRHTLRPHASRSTRHDTRTPAQALARAHRLRPLLDHGIPWLTVQVGLELTRAHLALGDADAARTILTETEQSLELRPRMGSLVDEARGLHDRVAATSGSAGAWAMSLTRRGASAAPVPGHPPHLPGDREQAVPLAQHGQDRSGLGSTASSVPPRAARRSNEPSRSGFSRLDLPAADKSHPGGMTRRRLHEFGSTMTEADGRLQGAPTSARRARRCARRRIPFEGSSSRRRSSTADRGTRPRRRDDRRRRGPLLVPARSRARPRRRSDER